MTKKLTDEEKVERATERSSKLERRQRERVLIAKGFVRCKPYLANLALYNDIPTEEGPGLADTDVQWVPAWFEWHLQRFKHTLAHFCGGLAREGKGQYLLGARDP